MDELQQCVQELASCNAKLERAQEVLDARLKQTQQTFLSTGLPSLRATVSVKRKQEHADVNATSVDQVEQHLQQGMELVKELEARKARTERESERREEQVREIVESRDVEIQKEYSRIMREVEDQIASSIEKSKALKEAIRIKRQEHDISTPSGEEDDPQTEIDQLQEEISELSTSVGKLQSEYARLDEGDEEEEEESSGDHVALETERLERESSRLQQEIQVLEDTYASLTEQHQTPSQYEQELKEAEEELTYEEGVVQDLLSEHQELETRFHQLLRIVAPSADLRPLMERLYAHLAPERADSNRKRRKTLDLNDFLKSCPSERDGQRAVDELVKLQLVCYYESSGMLTWAN